MSNIDSLNNPSPIYTSPFFSTRLAFPPKRAVAFTVVLKPSPILASPLPQAPTTHPLTDRLALRTKRDGLQLLLFPFSSLLGWHESRPRAGR